MNFLLELLEGGDLRSDGHADEVADEVISNQELFKFLMDGLEESEDLIRGRTAHALEKVSRVHPELFDDYFDHILARTSADQWAMVRWHLEMLLVNLNLTPPQRQKVIEKLKYLLKDPNIFVISWAISGLTILLEDSPESRNEIILSFKKLEDHKSAAIRNRTAKAIRTLECGDNIPKGWVKRGV